MTLPLLFVSFGVFRGHSNVTVRGINLLHPDRVGNKSPGSGVAEFARIPSLALGPMIGILANSATEALYMLRLTIPAILAATFVLISVPGHRPTAEGCAVAPRAGQHVDIAEESAII